MYNLSIENRKEIILKGFSENYIKGLEDIFLNSICFIVDSLSVLSDYKLDDNTVIISKDKNDSSYFHYDNEFIYFDIFAIKIEVVEFSILLGCKVIIGQKEINNEVEIFNKHGVNHFNFTNLTPEKIKNILNFINVIVIRDVDENYSVSSVIRHLIKSFDDLENSKLFLENGLKLLTTKNIINGHYVDDDIDDFIESINNKMHNLSNSIIFGIHPFGLSKIKKINKEYKKILWQDDLHWFANFVERNGLSVQKFDKKYHISSLDDIDLLITPSIKYFENLNITEYQNRTKFLFYSLNTNFFDEIKNTFSERKSKIILSGEINSGYSTRLKLKELSKINFKSIVDIIEHPGYSNNEHMTELNYYKKLSEYKAAFVGHYNYPLNFPLAKHIEVLMCGCLGFFQRNDSLKKDLGLEEFVHYIPCTDDNDNLIEDENFYLKWIDSQEGKEIAKNAMLFVQKKFGKENLINYIECIKSIKT